MRWPMSTVFLLTAMVGTLAIVWSAETVAEPEELATEVTASARDVGAVAFGKHPS